MRKPSSGKMLGREDSNLRMSIPKTDALPLGDGPICVIPRVQTFQMAALDIGFSDCPERYALPDYCYKAHTELSHFPTKSSSQHQPGP